ncbi:hypothetical protein P4C99_02620 [Pontiellaceae bacterium B1224]|nr:hypothetical protein [Pontiellaceae bacterium B1224]
MADNKSFESTLHDIVYSIDTGTGLKIIRVLLYILLLLLVVMVFTATQFRGLKSEEAMDLCQLGRNISVEQGLTTKTVRPLSMWKMQEQNPNEDPMIGNHPDLFNAPAYPALLSLGFKFFDLIGVDPFEMPEGARGVAMPAEQWVVLPLNHIFSILTGLILFSLGKRMFSREIGFLGMTIYYLSNLVWMDSVSGLNVSMGIFFSVASFHSMVIAMLNKRDRLATVKWLIPFLLSIVLAGVAFYTRFITATIVPGICLFAWLMAGRFRGGTRFVLVFLVLYGLMISPWLVRNYQICGNPIGMVGYVALEGSPQFVDNALDRDYHPELTGSLISTALKQKWKLNYSGAYAKVIPGMGGGLLMAFFLTTFFYHFVRPQVNYLRWGLGLSLLLMVIVAGFFSESSMLMLHLFWPFVILYGLAFFYILIDRLDLGVRLYNLGLKVLVAVLAFIPFLLSLMPPAGAHPYPPYYAPIIGGVAGMLNEREVLVTDMPWATAWYGDRVSILLPKDLDQFYEINDYKQYISGMYFTTITKNKPFVKGLLDGPEQSWLPIMTGRTPPDFPLKQAVALSRQDQLFLSDRDRWSNSGAGGGEAAQPEAP